MITLSGSLQDVIRKAQQLRDNPTPHDKNEELILRPGESTICYTFHDLTFEGVESSRKWVAFRVNTARSNNMPQAKWHIVPTDRMDLFHYGEHDGLDTMCGILEAKVHSSSFGGILLAILHSVRPPYRIENRSSSSYVQFVQDDDYATLFGYTWDFPFRKKSFWQLLLARNAKISSS